MSGLGGRIGLSPGGPGRGGRFCRGVLGHGRLPGSGPPDDPGLVPIGGPGSRSVRTLDRSASAMTIRKTLPAADEDGAGLAGGRQGTGRAAPVLCQVLVTNP